MIWNLDKVKNSDPHPAPVRDRGEGTGVADWGSGGVRALVVWLSRMMRRGNHWLRRFIPQGGAMMSRMGRSSHDTWLHVACIWKQNDNATPSSPHPHFFSYYFSQFEWSSVLWSDSYLIYLRNVSRFSGQGGVYFLKMALFLIHHVYPDIFSHVTYSLASILKNKKSSFDVVSGHKYSHNLDLSLKSSATTKVSMLILYYQVFLFIWEKNTKSSKNTFCLLNAFD